MFQRRAITNMAIHSQKTSLGFLCRFGYTILKDCCGRACLYSRCNWKILLPSENLQSLDVGETVVQQVKYNELAVIFKKIWILGRIRDNFDVSWWSFEA